MNGDEDRLIRLAVFTRLSELVQRYGESVPWSALVQGVPFRGDRVQVIGQQGIVFPRRMSAPLSIMTTGRSGSRRPYDDEVGPDGLLRYLQECHGKVLSVVPRRILDRPGSELLEERFELFRAAG